jgi:uncharacterized protein HemX
MKKLLMILGVAVASIGFGYAQQGQTHEGDRQYKEGHREGQRDRTEVERENQRDRSRMDDQEFTRDFDNNQKERIDLERLPSNIHSNLNTGEYSDWEIEEAYRIDDQARRETGVAYEVRVNRRGHKKLLHYDEQGNFMPSKDKDRDRR